MCVISGVSFLILWRNGFGADGYFVGNINKIDEKVVNICIEKQKD